MAEEYIPDSSAMTTILPAILGLVSAGALWAIACICSRQMRARKRKKIQNLAKTRFQPKARQTAVRSPSGQPPHYLKKSPSPTDAKQLGILQPTQERTATLPISPQTITYMDEHEIKARMYNNYKHNEKLSTSGGGSHGNQVSVVQESIFNPMTVSELNIEQYGKLGSIFFKVRHLGERNALMVSIMRCRGLPARSLSSYNGVRTSNLRRPVDMSGGRTQPSTDPYVKLQLLPDKQHKVKTRVVRNTRNPVYDEDFTFYGLNMDDLQNMSLHFIILSFDRYSRDDVIGEVVCPLSSIEIANNSKSALSISKEIQPRSLKIRAQSRGELLVSLCWQPAAGRLTVVLLKARNLPRMDVTGLADPYVKIYLMYNNQRIAKKKTHVKKRTLNPVFNESFAFDIPTAQGTRASLDGVGLELLLLDWDRVTKNEVIGRLELGGPNASDTPLDHWGEMCCSPRRQIAEWHRLME